MSSHRAWRHAAAHLILDKHVLVREVSDRVGRAPRDSRRGLLAAAGCRRVALEQCHQARQRALVCNQVLVLSLGGKQPQDHARLLLNVLPGVGAVCACAVSTRVQEWCVRLGGRARRAGCFLVKNAGQACPRRRIGIGGSSAVRSFEIHHFPTLAIRRSCSLLLLPGPAKRPRHKALALPLLT